MKTIMIVTLAALCLGCAASIPICDEALKTRKEANSASGEQKAVLESKAAGLEDACARERERSYEQFRNMNKPVRK